MSYLCCTSNLVVNENQTATVTIELCDVCYKTIKTSYSDPEEWINSLVKNTIESRANSIYQRLIDTHLRDGTMPAGATKRSLIISYDHDPSQPLPP